MVWIITGEMNDAAEVLTAVYDNLILLLDGKPVCIATSLPWCLIRS